MWSCKLINTTCHQNMSLSTRRPDNKRGIFVTIQVFCYFMMRLAHKDMITTDVSKLRWLKGVFSERFQANERRSL
ncbi:hypothetical protein Hanom_Chr11g00969501 [Helianthus anomalus]